MDATKFRAQWEADEGFVPHAYRDSEGYWTIGHGILIDHRRGGGITVEESRYLVDNRIAKTCRALDREIPWWRTLDGDRSEALLMMAMNLGVTKLLMFKKMIAALEHGFWTAAADEALDSLWATQVGNRAQRIAETFKTGK